MLCGTIRFWFPHETEYRIRRQDICEAYLSSRVIFVIAEKTEICNERMVYA